MSLLGFCCLFVLKLKNKRRYCQKEKKEELWVWQYKLLVLAIDIPLSRLVSEEPSCRFSLKIAGFLKVWIRYLLRVFVKIYNKILMVVLSFFDFSNKDFSSGNTFKMEFLFEDNRDDLKNLKNIYFLL